MRPLRHISTCLARHHRGNQGQGFALTLGKSRGVTEWVDGLCPGLMGTPELKPCGALIWGLEDSRHSVSLNSWRPWRPEAAFGQRGCSPTHALGPVQGLGDRRRHSTFVSRATIHAALGGLAVEGWQPLGTPDLTSLSLGL